RAWSEGGARRRQGRTRSRQGRRHCRQNSNPWRYRACGVGAVRLGLGPAAIDAGSRLARGQSLGAALKGAVAGQIDALRNQLKLAEMVAPFVPGIGTGVAAALGAANALAAGRPITQAVLASPPTA